ncbi:MAG: HAD family hydrolase [Clostridia bacterium]|nr:HAD family hydrolase [Clostridia bacterium]
MKAILFDLDGTLLPMEPMEFVKAYLKYLTAWMLPKGYDPEKLNAAVWKGTEAAIKNDGSCTNEARFWQSFVEVLGEKVLEDKPFIDEFYIDEFNKAKESCGFDERAKKVIDFVKPKFDKVILATNPVFPCMATYHRANWAGVDKSDFDLVTTYENSSFCKPKAEYYKEILEKTGLSAKDCIMVGNDVDEDMRPASALGMKVFLVRDYLINRSNSDISAYPQGTLDDLIDWLKTM